eukprot:2572039-Amphidinium_carterae.1
MARSSWIHTCQLVCKYAHVHALDWCAIGNMLSGSFVASAKWMSQEHGFFHVLDTFEKQAMVTLCSRTMCNMEQVNPTEHPLATKT